MAQEDLAYRFLNAATHSRSSPSLQAPTLVCHFAFWCDRPFDNDDRSKWRSDIDHAVAKTIDALSTRLISNDAVVGEWIVYFKHLATTSKPLDLLLPTALKLSLQEQFLLKSDLRSISLRADFGYGYLDIRFEMHSEYCSVTHYFTMKQIQESSDGLGFELNRMMEKAARFCEASSNRMETPISSNHSFSKISGQSS